MITGASSPWWQRLPEDYYRSPQSTTVDSSHKLKVQGSAAIDLVLRTGLASLVTLAMGPALASSARLRREQALMPFYAALADRADPAAVFMTPPRQVPITVTDSPLLAYRPKNIPTQLLRFNSPYQALHPEVRADYAHHHRNRQVYAQHWTHPDGPRKTLIFMHGYLLDSYGINSLLFSLRWFYKKGYDILLYTLPFHGYRQGHLHPFSGFGYFANGFAHVNEAMLQSIYDLRILMNYLEDRGVPQMGVSGLSLGGYLTSLAACVDERLSFAIPNAPVVSPADMLMEWQPTSWVFRQLMPRVGLRVADIRHDIAVHAALTYPPKLTPDRLLVIGGAGDRFTAPRYVKLLHEHWAGSRMHWFPGNHIMHLHQGEYLRLMLRFMDDCCARPLPPR